MIGKINPKGRMAPKSDDADRQAPPYGSRAVRARMRRMAPARRGAAVAASVLIVVAGLGAQVAAADEPGSENAAAETACKVAAERAMANVKPHVPLSEQVPDQARSSRAGYSGRRAHRHAGRADRRAVVSVAGWGTALTDSIGPYTMVLLPNDEGQSKCLMGPPAEPLVSLSGGGGESILSLGADQIGNLGLGLSTTHDFKPFSDISGRTGLDVRAVRFTLQNGSRVSAVVANGWFLAFWEGAQQASSVEIVSAGGTHAELLAELIIHEYHELTARES
ncbi:MAG TPA: hypothetical protein VG147_11255 [Solirubrobacteraceae bacterium]|nr:hypothetical protein [Solirubrobacteraceae bacterium]